MHLPFSICLTAVLFATQCKTSVSSKRGLVYVPSKKHPGDDNIWDSPGSDLTWYYNYQSTPSHSFDDSDKLQFVPMLFGASDPSSGSTFLDDVRSQIKGGAKIPYALAFNEPDGVGNGGSNVPVDTAVDSWIRQMEPLKKLGVQLGAPAVTGGPTGKTWLENFFRICRGRCSVDFIPVHWYGNFEGLASHIGEVRQAYPNKTIWITEFAYNDVSLLDSQSFYNSSTEYFDRIEWVFLAPDPRLKAYLYPDILPTTLILGHSGAMCRMLDQMLLCLHEAVNSLTSGAGISEEAKQVIFQVVVQSAKQRMQDLDSSSSAQAFGHLCK